MLRVKRRQLLQFFGSAIGSLGLSQFEIQQQALRFAKVLAQDTPRKRALLVGVNQYVDPRLLRLNGAVNDTHLQKELLIHRFGFDPSNIFVLVDQDATRENILRAFEENFIKWAKPGDVVVFHFSGHGSQVADPDKVFEDGRVSTIVPINSSLPPGYPNKGGRVNDITGHTLWLLMKAINTDNVTFVLDSCYSGGARNGLLTARSRPGDQELIRGQDLTIQLLVSQKEQEYQQQLLSRLNLASKDFATQRKKGVPKGIMLAAARREQEAIDAPFADTYAGLFTYVLTRYLWQQASTDSASTMMASATTTIQRFLQEHFPSSGPVQQPEFNVREASNLAQQAVYFLSTSNPPAEAVITNVKGNQVDLFLGGIEPRSLEAFGRGAIFTLAKGQGQIQIVSREQFTAKGMVIQAGATGSITPGNLLQESSRAIPSDLALRIGLDSSLGQEMAVAKQALLIIKRIEPVSTQQPDLQYILGRITPDYRQKLQGLKVKNVPEVDSIALFSPAEDLIPGSAGAAGEDVTSAVKRLKPKLKSLLAARLVKLTLNTTSSRLNVAAALQRVEGEQIQAEAFTVRGKSITPLSQTRGQTTRSANAQRLTPGTLVQFLIQNNESRDLYVSVLLFSVDGELSVLSPLPGNEDAPPVRAGQQIQVPDPARGESYHFKIVGEPGVVEALVIASTTPLKRAISLLQTLAAEPDRSRGKPMNLDKEPDAAIASLLDDLDEGSRGNGTASLPGVRQIDTRQIAALSITFEVTRHDS